MQSLYHGCSYQSRFARNVQAIWCRPKQSSQGENLPRLIRQGCIADMPLSSVALCVLSTTRSNRQHKRPQFRVSTQSQPNPCSHPADLPPRMPPRPQRPRPNPLLIHHRHRLKLLANPLPPRLRLSNVKDRAYSKHLPKPSRRHSARRLKTLPNLHRV